MARELVCALCGTRYDADEAVACATCPLGARCRLVCCPACGYGTVDGGGSRLVGLGRRLLRRGARPVEATLATCPPGARVLIDTVDALPEAERERLAAYGIVPGSSVHVVQSSPVTIVRSEHLELALERGIARAIAVAEAAA